jgi:hypothetical protein
MPGKRGKLLHFLAITRICHVMAKLSVPQPTKRPFPPTPRATSICSATTRQPALALEDSS